MSRLLLRPLGLPCTGAGAGATAARRDFPAKRPAPQQKEGTSTPTDSGDGTDTGPALVPSAGPDKRHHRRRQRGRRLGATTEPRTARGWGRGMRCPRPFGCGHGPPLPTHPSTAPTTRPMPHDAALPPPLLLPFRRRAMSGRGGEGVGVAKPPTALATSSNRLPIHFWGRL